MRGCDGTNERAQVFLGPLGLGSDGNIRGSCDLRLHDRRFFLLRLCDLFGKSHPVNQGDPLLGGQGTEVIPHAPFIPNVLKSPGVNVTLSSLPMIGPSFQDLSGKVFQGDGSSQLTQHAHDHGTLPLIFLLSQLSSLSYHHIQPPLLSGSSNLPKYGTIVPYLTKGVKDYISFGIKYLAWALVGVKVNKRRRLQVLDSKSPIPFSSLSILLRLRSVA